MSTGEFTAIARRFLRAHPFASRQIEPTAAIIGRCQQRALADGEHLCDEGGPGDAIYWLLSGSVRVTRAGASSSPSRRRR